MREHGGLITLIIHEKSNEHIQKVARHPSVRRWALIKVCLFGIWIMNKHWRETAAINLPASPSYSKPRRIRTFQFLIPIFHDITPLEKIQTVSLSTERYDRGLFSYEPHPTSWYAIDIVAFFLSFRHQSICFLESRDMCDVYTVKHHTRIKYFII